MRRCRSRLPCYLPRTSPQACYSFHGSSLPQLHLESGSQVKARSVLDHPRTCRGEAQAPTQVDVCKASTDTVVSHKLSRNADSRLVVPTEVFPILGAGEVSSDSFGTVPAYLGATSPTFHQTSLNRDSL